MRVQDDENNMVVGEPLGQPLVPIKPRSPYWPLLDQGLGWVGRPRRRPWYRDGLLLGVITAALVLDQVTKHLVRQGMRPGQAIPEEGLVQLHYVTNTGSAFGLFQGQTLFLIPASLLGIVFLVLFYRRHTYLPWAFRLAVGLLLGGALGNLVDRILWREVTDFIAIGWFPNFNIADSAIVSGIALLIGLLFLFGEPREAGDVPAGGERESAGEGGPNSQSISVQDEELR